jgi:hypothetical protein
MPWFRARRWWRVHCMAAIARSEGMELVAFCDRAVNDFHPAHPFIRRLVELSELPPATVIAVQRALLGVVKRPDLVRRDDVRAFVQRESGHSLDVIDRVRAAVFRVQADVTASRKSSQFHQGDRGCAGVSATDQPR